MSASSSHTPVLVVGAGLTGLSAALHLRRAGVACRVLERATEPGGHARTTREDGFAFDRTGHLLHLRDPSLAALVEEVVEGELLSLERRSRVWSHGVMTRYPFQANTFGLPPAVAYECVLGFVRAHERAELGGAARNFEEFCLARFGEGMTRHFLVPYNEKLWGVRASEITAAWCERFVPVPTLEDVLAGAVGLADRELGYNARFRYPRGGIDALPRGLARAVGPIELGRAPAAIDVQRKRVVLPEETITYDVLLSTIPLDSMLALVPHLPPEVERARGSLRCNPLAWLDLAFDAPAASDLHWVYVPEPRYPFYRVGCYSNFSPGVAPAGCSSFYVELADRKPADLDSLVPLVVAQLAELGLVGRGAPLRFARLRRVSHAYVVFDHAYYGALAAIRPYLAAHGVESAGRYGAWNYSSMEDALAFGRDAARAAAARV